MAPRHEHTAQLLGDLPLGKEHPKYLVTEDLLKLLAHNDRSNPESTCAYDAAIRAQNVAAGVESQKIPKCLDGIHSPGHGIFTKHKTLQIEL